MSVTSKTAKKTAKRKDPHAVALGRKGGLKRAKNSMSTFRERREAASILGKQGGKVRWKESTEQDRLQFALMGAAARWPSFRQELEQQGERLNTGDERNDR